MRDPREFRALKLGGKRMVTRHLIANWQELPAGNRSRLGIITTRKNGNAVARSRARRWLREAFRRHQVDLARPAAMVLVARPSLARQSFAQVERDYLHVLKHSQLAHPL